MPGTGELAVAADELSVNQQSLRQINAGREQTSERISLAARLYAVLVS
jgi:hypothetical protein